MTFEFQIKSFLVIIEFIYIIFYVRLLNFIDNIKILYTYMICLSILNNFYIYCVL